MAKAVYHDGEPACTLPEIASDVRCILFIGADGVREFTCSRQDATRHEWKLITLRGCQYGRRLWPNPQTAQVGMAIVECLTQGGRVIAKTGYSNRPILLPVSPAPGKAV